MNSFQFICVFALAISHTAYGVPRPNDNDTGFRDTYRQGLPFEAWYLKSQAQKTDGRGFYRMFAKRPGSATRTHSCNTVRRVPEELRSPRVMRPHGLSQFYQKYTEAYGIPVVSSGAVDDDALKRACYTVRYMLADNANVRQAFYESGGRLGVIGKNEKTNDIPEHSNLDDYINRRARGLGATMWTPISTCAEENALCHRSDGWYGDDIVLHEFLHGLHSLGLNQAWGDFEQRMMNLYHVSKQDGRWQNTYAMSTEYEYFAETGQSYLNSHIFIGPPSNGVHNHIGDRKTLKDFDRTMHDLFHKEIFTCRNEYLPPCDENLSSAELREREHRQVLKMDCSDTGSGGGSVCKDYNEKCAEYGALNYCRISKGWEEWMSMYCQKTCGICR